MNSLRRQLEDFFDPGSPRDSGRKVDSAVQRQLEFVYTLRRARKQRKKMLRKLGLDDATNIQKKGTSL